MRISDWSSDVCSSDLPLAAEPGVAPDDDAHIGPGLAQPVHQQTQHRRRVAGPIDAAGPQQAGQHRLATEHVQRQIEVMVVVAVDMLEFLIAMQDRKSTRLKYSHSCALRMQSSA